MEKQNATTAFTYENIYGLCFCALQTHPLLLFAGCQLIYADCYLLFQKHRNMLWNMCTQKVT